MRIGLIDADLMDGGTRHPNLAIMKLSGYFKANNHEVELIWESYDKIEEYDRVYISKVFNFTKTGQFSKDDFEAMDNVYIGGTGFYTDGGKPLPIEIEHHMPDYHIYDEFVELHTKTKQDISRYSDYRDYSIGFTTRGCFRKCAFCVNKKYDKVQKHAAVSEFLDHDRPKIYLWDDNILGFPEWEKVIDELEATGKPFHFKQGIDLRLMTEQKAKRFNQVKYHGDFTFAFDHLKDKDSIVANVQLWKMYSGRIPRMYVLSGFDSQDEKDIDSVFERIHTLMKYGSLPYIMRYEEYKNSKYRSLYIQLARWCNQPQFYKKKSFREFCILNDSYKKTEGHSSAMTALNDFEKDHPEIAAKYFDLKFEQENFYFNQGYGEEQRYLHKRPCEYCRNMKLDWNTIYKLTDLEFLGLIVSKKVNLKCMEYPNSECKMHKKYLNKLERALNTITEQELFSYMKQNNNLDFGDKPIKSKQYKVTLGELLEILPSIHTSEQTVDEVVESINKYKIKPISKDRIVNISLFAARLGLVTVLRKSNKRYVSITRLGDEFKRKELTIKEKWLNLLQFTDPFFQYLLKEERVGNEYIPYLHNMTECNLLAYKQYQVLEKES